MSPSARNCVGGVGEPEQEATSPGRFATGSATGGAEPGGEGGELLKALKRLEVEVERVGDEQLREVMAEVWGCWRQRNGS